MHPDVLLLYLASTLKDLQSGNACFVLVILHVCTHRLYWAQAAEQQSQNVKRVLFTSNKQRGSDILGAFP